jgi:hypothetical protein
VARTTNDLAERDRRVIRSRMDPVSRSHMDAFNGIAMMFEGLAVSEHAQTLLASPRRDN